MKVSELIEYLKKLPQDAEVIMSKDAEGNGFSPWCGEHSQGFYAPDTSWYADFYTQKDIDEDPDYEYSPSKPCIVLWPTS